ncbi:methionine biosynthesis protein MetW [Thalassoroseus pseudoceratinae]|uniref:methionine biosynthesis protein MetW n=1 Tax=Thalassoroseus pseudoceratinae TaxID=2713176 RepID=UPI001F0FE83B|nr:methionine biosynthesis protein MetW [Thalassoroseus pseudoceratinae]
MSSQRYCMPDPMLGLNDKLIRDQIRPGSRVVDLGCGDGRLLAMLRDEHGCSVQGVELDQESIEAAISRGVAVIRADLDRGLDDIPSQSFDVAVLSQTLQQVRQPKAVLEEMYRIARWTLVVVPNFAHWRVRWQALSRGRAPVTSELPYEWYNTPNLHVMSMTDFRDLANVVKFRIDKEIPIIRRRAVRHAWAANLRAESALYVLERTE